MLHQSLSLKGERKMKYVRAADKAPLFAFVSLIVLLATHPENRTNDDIHFKYKKFQIYFKPNTVWHV